MRSTRCWWSDSTHSDVHENQAEFLFANNNAQLTIASDYFRSKSWLNNRTNVDRCANEFIDLCDSIISMIVASLLTCDVFKLPPNYASFVIIILLFNNARRTFSQFCKKFTIRWWSWNSVNIPIDRLMPALMAAIKMPSHWIIIGSFIRP